MSDKEIQHLEKIYRDNYSLLYNYGMKIISDDYAVKDIIQHVFLKVCYKNQILTVQNPRAYLVRSMRNACYDLISKKYKFISIEDMEFNPPFDEDIFNSVFSVDDANMKRWKNVTMAINKLSPRQKQILWLFYVQNMSHKEIAEALGISSQASMNTISRAINKIRQYVSIKELQIGLLIFSPLTDSFFKLF